MHVRRLLSLLLLLAATAAAQNTASTEVVFELDHPALTPKRYSISIAQDGRATYSTGDDTEALSFTATPETKDKVFQLAAQAKLFRQDCAFQGKEKIAFSGNKTLRFVSAGKPEGECRFNYSGDPAVQQLMGIFQGIAATAGFGQRLQHKLRFDKLSLHDEMKSMEDMFNRGMLAEVQAIAPVLRQLAEDMSVMRTARERARKLLRRSVTD